MRRESLLASRRLEWGPVWARRDPLLYLLVTKIARDPAASPSGEAQDYPRCKPFSCHERWFGNSLNGGGQATGVKLYGVGVAHRLADLGGRLRPNFLAARQALP